jgi:hypothetical protein
MAANPTTKNKTADRPARELTTYDLAIGILAIFSLILLVLIYFVPLSSATVDVLNSLCKIREGTQQESGLKYSIIEVYSTVTKTLWRQRGCSVIWNDQRCTT